MKNIKILLALLAVVGLSLSCTKDSNSGSGSEGGNNSQRVVSKIIFEDVKFDDADEYAFKYDSYGRITRVTHTEIEDSYEEICCYERYKYGSGNELVIECEDDGYEAYVYEATLNNNGYLSTVYYENDDYTEEWSYTYDTKGRLISVLNEHGSDENEYVYKWSGGNVVETTFEDEGDLSTIYISYNSKSMDMVNIDLNAALGGFVGGLYIDVCDNGYHGYHGYHGDGLCGQKSKNFMTGLVNEEYEQWEYSLKWSYDEDGYPVGAVVAENGEEYCRVSIEYKK